MAAGSRLLVFVAAALRCAAALPAPGYVPGGASRDWAKAVRVAPTVHVVQPLEAEAMERRPQMLLSLQEEASSVSAPEPSFPEAPSPEAPSTEAAPEEAPRPRPRPEMEATSRGLTLFLARELHSYVGRFVLWLALAGFVLLLGCADAAPGARAPAASKMQGVFDPAAAKDAAPTRAVAAPAKRDAAAAVVLEDDTAADPRISGMASAKGEAAAPALGDAVDAIVPVGRDAVASKGCCRRRWKFEAGQWRLQHVA